MHSAAAGSLPPCTTPTTAASIITNNSRRTNSSSSSSFHFHNNTSISGASSWKKKKFGKQYSSNNGSSSSSSATITWCKASSRSWSTSEVGLKDLDLYELLGVDSDSDQTQIKMAYRKLQKRCHPDIAGPSGHDMAIILNQVYSILSDPYTRLLYDKEHAKVVDIRGYTGKPIYSVWFGSENEERAVFVDEVKCVGCLKCALLADKTFAIESVYGRARVVAQWADPENQIQEAIQACPVDCIAVVERSNLAALEFLMSKQPRGKVRIGVGNTVGERTPDVFDELERFLARFQDAAKSKASTEARSVAIEAIRSISNWLYWQAPIAQGGNKSLHSLTHYVHKHDDEPSIIKKLQEAVAARNRASKNPKLISQISSSNYTANRDEEYWTPLAQEDLSSYPTTSTQNLSTTQVRGPTQQQQQGVSGTRRGFTPQRKRIKRDPVLWGIPLATSLCGATIVHFQVPEVNTLQDHAGGALLLGIVNSSWQQVFLAGVTWFLVGMAILQLLGAIQYVVRMNKE